MLTGSAGLSGKFRAWVEPLPDAFCGSQDIASFYVNRPSLGLTLKTSILILELKIARGARVVYGLLGAKYESMPSSNRLEVCLPSSEFQSRLFEASLIQGFETAIVGIVPEYSDFAMSGIQKAVGTSAVLPGRLDICYSAHGKVSSNGLVFEKLGFALTKLLCNTDPFPSGITSEAISKELI